tara:strand:+ start:10410 stop:11201 length:792 start_codon:yes stop_codon:yes gene_type:complete
MEINKINDFNLETGYNYVVTIALLLHGCIISTDSILIDNLTFNNVTGNKFEMTHFSTNDKKKLHDNIKNNFRKDQLIANNSNVLPYDKIIGETSPQDHSYLNCDIVNYIKKVIGLEMNGIFIISVHRKPSESIENNYQYLYPPNKNSIINIGNLKGLKHLCDSFDENIYNNIYQKLLLDNGKFGNSNNFDLELNSSLNHIKYIRLTYLLNLLKNIFGFNCHLNVYDYTCSIMCRSPTNRGGKKRKTKKRKTSKKRKSKDHFLN